MDAYDLMMIEQPLHYEDMWDHAKLQKQIKTPICLDESIHSLEDARRAIEMGATRIINIKAGRVGGLSSARNIQKLAAEHGIPVWCGGMLESGVGRAHNVHLSTLDNFTLPGDVADSKRYFVEEIIEPTVQVRKDGTIAVPDGPGIGSDVRWDRVEKHLVRSEPGREEASHRKREDAGIRPSSPREARGERAERRARRALLERCGTSGSRLSFFRLSS
jgi:O-succinylbenzoate synthase